MMHFSALVVSLAVAQLCGAICVALAAVLWRALR
jgi:hypothetical protein